MFRRTRDTAPLHWVVIAVLANGQSVGTCGHRHADELEAVRCPWTPSPWPVCCDLLVRQVRTEQRYQLGLLGINDVREVA
jgi:hypothetical protein